MKSISVGDILYCTKREEILYVTGVGTDEHGQNAIVCSKRESDIGRKTQYIYAAFLAFKFMVKVGKA